jgi:hypothetical protein
MGLCDGAPLNFLLAVVELFNHMFPEQWTGRGGSSAWPAHPTRLNPLDIYPWGYLKSTLHVNDVSGVHGLQQRTQNGPELICTTPGIF